MIKFIKKLFGIKKIEQKPMLNRSNINVKIHNLFNELHIKNNIMFYLFEYRSYINYYYGNNENGEEYYSIISTEFRDILVALNTINFTLVHKIK